MMDRRLVHRGVRIALVVMLGPVLACTSQLSGPEDGGRPAAKEASANEASANEASTNDAPSTTTSDGPLDVAAGTDTTPDIPSASDMELVPDGPPVSCAPDEIGTPPNCFPAPPVTAAPGKAWTVTFNEEFNGTDYDHSKLTPCFDWNYGACTSSFNKGREHYDPGQVQVSGGTAKLIAEPLNPPLDSTDCYQDQCTYKSGLLSTCRPNAGDGSDYLYTFTHGYVEVRMMFPATQGFFTALWMLPADPTYSYATEIDIVEILGDDPQTIFMTYHYNNRTQSYPLNSGIGNNGSCPVKDYSTGFHDFGMDWQPTHVAWYIDGVKCGQFSGTTAQVESGPMQLIVDLMVDHSWQQSWDVMLQDTTLVRQIEIDYIRVYQQVP